MNKLHSFRKKPVIIEAVQYTCTADNLREITDWARNCNSQAVRIDTETRNRSAEHPEGFDYPVLKIETLEGVMQANVGDWIIKGVNGEFYPCKPDIFAKTYDAAEVGEGMSFGQALEAIKAGKRIARTGWNGKGMWLVLVPGTPVAQLRDGTPYREATGLEQCEILPHIDMWTVNAEGRRAMLPGWLASQSDMLADDWAVVGG